MPRLKPKTTEPKLDYLTPEQVAEVLQCSLAHVKHLTQLWPSPGGLRHFRLGNRIRVDRADLAEFAERKKAEAELPENRKGFPTMRKQKGGSE
jgi:excisionase family DNA binding protein